MKNDGSTRRGPEVESVYFVILEMSRKYSLGRSFSIRASR